jgi:hypothetical protein
VRWLWICDFCEDENADYLGMNRARRKGTADCAGDSEAELVRTVSEPYPTFLGFACVMYHSCVHLSMQWR